LINEQDYDGFYDYYKLQTMMWHMHEQLQKEETNIAIKETILGDKTAEFASPGDITDIEKNDLSNDLFEDDLYVWKLLLYKAR
jgi:hypothetical protein